MLANSNRGICCSIIDTLCATSQLSENTKWNDKENAEGGEKRNRDGRVGANSAGATSLRVVHSAKRFMAFGPDVLPAEMAHRTKWGWQDICAETAESKRASGKVLAETHVTRIGGIGHDFEPALKGGHLKEGQVGPADVVKLHLRVSPLGVILLEAG